MKSSTTDLWTHLLWTILFINYVRDIRKYFSYTDIAHGEDHSFALAHPANLFKILGVCLFHDKEHTSLHATRGKYATSHLHFVVISLDAQDQAKVYPTKSFRHKLPERQTFYVSREEVIPNDSLYLFRPASHQKAAT